MTQSISPYVFSKTASQKLLQASSKQDFAIQEFAQLILQENLSPQNSEIQFIQGKTDILAKFSKTGNLTFLARKDRGYLYNQTSRAAFPSLETPGPVAKYKWITNEAPAIKKSSEIDLAVGTIVMSTLGIAVLIAAVGPEASGLLGIAGAGAITAIAAPIIITFGAVAAVTLPIMAAGAIMTAAITLPMLAVSAMVTAVVSPFLFPFVVLSALVH